MILIQDEPSIKFSDLKSWKNYIGFKNKKIMGTSIFFFVPSYKTVVERIIIGFKSYESMLDCAWERPYYDFSYRDPSLPDIEDWDVCEGSLLLKLVHPKSVPTRETTMLLHGESGNWEIAAYSAGKLVSGENWICSTEKEALENVKLIIKQSRTIGRKPSLSLRAITPAKDGVTLSQQRLLATMV